MRARDRRGFGGTSGVRRGSCPARAVRCLWAPARGLHVGLPRRDAGTTPARGYCTAGSIYTGRGSATGACVTRRGAHWSPASSSPSLWWPRTSPGRSAPRPARRPRCRPPTRFGGLPMTIADAAGVFTVRKVDGCSSLPTGTPSGCCPCTTRTRRSSTAKPSTRSTVRTRSHGSRRQSAAVLVGIENPRGIHEHSWASRRRLGRPERQGSQASFVLIMNRCSALCTRRNAWEFRKM